MKIVLNGRDLTVTEVIAVARHGQPVTLAPEALGQGDLGPMADLAHGLITRSGFEVAENEGLALVSSNAFTTAWACVVTAEQRIVSAGNFDIGPLAAALDFARIALAPW